VLHDAVAQRTFPARFVSGHLTGKTCGAEGLGPVRLQPDCPQVTTTRVFDLASVSKAAATTRTDMILYQGGLLDLEAPIAAIAPEFAGFESSGTVKK